MPNPALPRRTEWLIRGFRRYVRRFLRKNFHAVRLSRAGYAMPTDGLPVLLVLNHPSWWDPMLCVALTDLLPGYKHFGAIDRDMLVKYRLFSRLGFFGVGGSSISGAKDFLRTGTAILSNEQHAVWITGQGEFADVRQRPLNLRSGVGHLAARFERGWVVPIALEYAFWNESQPEALARIGEPIAIQSNSGDGKTWTARIEAALTDSLNILNIEAMNRDEGMFQSLLDGKTGVGGMYNRFRRFASWMRGKKFDPSHGGKPT